MPMIDMPPSNHSCILSTMEFISNQAKKYSQTPIITFDQPLFWKAHEIQMQEQSLSDIVLILGHFHTRMSFLGSIGHLMTGSGLDSVLQLIYAENTGNISHRVIQCIIFIHPLEVTVMLIMFI